MYSPSFAIRLQSTDDTLTLSDLSAQVFGPERFARSSYRVREDVPPVGTLCFSAMLGERLVGGIRFTAIRIGEREGGLLLGPLVVDPVKKGKGIGKALVEEGLVRARVQSFSLVLLVGDLTYYGRFGFKPVRFGGIVLPGHVDPARLLALELVPGELTGTAGKVTGSLASGTSSPRDCELRW